MAHDTTKSPQRVPAWQVSANDAANTSDSLVVEGDNVQEIIDNLDVDTTTLITTNDITKEDAGKVITTDDITREDAGKVITTDDITREDAGKVITTDDITREDAASAVTSIVRLPATREDPNGGLTRVGREYTFQPSPGLVQIFAARGAFPSASRINLPAGSPGPWIRLPFNQIEIWQHPVLSGYVNINKGRITIPPTLPKRLYLFNFTIYTAGQSGVPDASRLQYSSMVEFNNEARSHAGGQQQYNLDYAISNPSTGGTIPYLFTTASIPVQTIPGAFFETSMRRESGAGVLEVFGYNLFVLTTPWE